LKAKSSRPISAAATIVISNQPNPLSQSDYATALEYSCPQRLHFFDYPVADPFVSFYYTTNINRVNVTCNKDG
jgi:hypothetical protein